VAALLFWKFEQAMMKNTKVEKGLGLQESATGNGDMVATIMQDDQVKEVAEELAKTAMRDYMDSDTAWLGSAFKALDGIRSEASPSFEKRMKERDVTIRKTSAELGNVAKLASRRLREKESRKAASRSIQLEGTDEPISEEEAVGVDVSADAVLKQLEEQKPVRE
jgi:hypothetical protein